MSMIEADPHFEALLLYLKEARGFDFTGYKRSTLMRRVNRRMKDASMSSYDEYKDHLEMHPGEFTALFNTILINVTGFFRDSEAWTGLQREALPEVLGRGGQGPLRFWSAGCASGEEAYSLAICASEILGTEEFRQRVKIYATDVDEEALADARQATYDVRSLRALPEEYLHRYFDVSGDRASFRKEVRRCVIFGRNDLVQDSPISHVDLLLCRNTLMYFNAETQAKVLQRLHFALNPGGVLMLGKAEMLLSHADLFAPIDLKRRLFRKLIPQGRRDQAVGTPADLRGEPDVQDRLTPVRDAAFLAGPVPQVVVDPNGRLATSNHRANALFGMSPRDIGRPFQDLEVSYRPLELRTYLDQARAEQRVIRVSEVEWARPSEERAWFDVEIVPLLTEEGSLLGTAAAFLDVSPYHALRDELEYANRQLETAYEELQSTNEELETTNEELQSTVEELETTNEELQSTNEELETMNDELQSINDELQSSNVELQARTAEVNSLNNFMQSVLTGLRAGVAVLDRNMRVRVWNDHAADLWGVRSDEAVGQQLLNLDIGLPLASVNPMIRSLLDGGEKNFAGAVLEAVNRQGRPILVRVTVSPLEDHDGVTGAIVVMEERPLPQPGPAGESAQSVSGPPAGVPDHADSIRGAGPEPPRNRSEM
jgi:two-component system, chemotaxis family, CheB/CheR fusion protein